MTSSEKRRTRGDFIEIYKIISGKVDMDSGKFFEKARNASTRGYQYKLFKRSAGSFRFSSTGVVETAGSNDPGQWKNIVLPEGY